jgi:hypothetical protein
MAKQQNRHLSTEELENIEIFLEHTGNIVGTTMRVPMRISHSIGDLTLHFYLELNK